MKMSVKERPWTSFYLGEIADVVSGCDIYEHERIVGDTPYVTATATNNGVGYFVGNQNSSYESDCISVNRNGSVGCAFYHPYAALFGNDTRKLRLHHRSKYVALFIVRMILSQKDKYEYGYKMGTGRLLRQKIQLPVKDDGKPDYDFMEMYMQSIERRLLQMYKKHLDASLKVTVSAGGGYKLKDIAWGDFGVNELFNIESGKRLESYKMTPGARPFVGASDSNNGITNFLSNDNCSKDRNVLGVNYNGSVGESFYHPYEALFSDDVKRFHLKQIPDDKYVLLFLKAAILKQKPKFDYGYKFNAERMARQRLVLPKAADGKPDYALMRRFMMNAETKLRRRYADARLKEL